MRITLAIVSSLLCFNNLLAQVDLDTTLYSYPKNDSSHKALVLTDELRKQLVDFKVNPQDADSLNLVGTTWYWFNIVDNSPEVRFSSPGGMKELLVYGAYDLDYAEAIQNINEGLYQPIYTFAMDSAGVPPAEFVVPELIESGLYLFKAKPFKKKAKIEMESASMLAAISENEAVRNRPWNSCFSCIDGEMPLPGNYLVTAWVSMENPAAGTTSYTGPQVSITTSSGNTTVTPANSDPQTYIIDGWQQIQGVFSIPTDNLILSISLGCTAGNCYFDDVRIQPVDASMKTFVFDPFTLRLAAELDERHYATIYEYDEEGRLKRIKKETERGVKSIQETSTSNVKVREN